MTRPQIIALTSLLFFILIGCSTDSMDKDSVDDGLMTESEELYFPPLNSDDWETISYESLGWNEAAIPSLFTFLEENSTDAFLILKNGRIAEEKYFGDFDKNKNHTWNSAAKTLTSLTVGIAQEEGFLSVDNPSSDYMGSGWSSLTSENELKITVRNHLTMTTGLDYTVTNNFCTDKECLIYKNEPDSFWYYHNATYTLLDKIISGAVAQDFEAYFNSKIRDKIGMQGSWIKVGYNNLYFSTARSMARFGLLNLNKGRWEEETLLSDMDYFTAMTSTSQELNKSYGYLWWLNGQDNFRLPESEVQFQGKLIPAAPDDLIAGLGAADQKLYVVPSIDLVIVRMGGTANSAALGPTSFDNALWEKINAIIN